MGNLLNYLDRFNDKKILVIGDLMLDEFEYGTIKRLNPEAPAPLINYLSTEYRIGGAGNVASNISSLAGQPILFSFIGKDPSADILRGLLSKSKISYYLDDNHDTILKRRTYVDGQQLMRVDFEKDSKKTFSKSLEQSLLQQANKCDYIIISDYNKGTITKSLMDLLSPYTSKMIVDPKPKNKILYHNVHLITPNEAESLELSRCPDLYEAGKKLKKELRSNVLITRGKEGMTLFYLESDRKVEIPTFARKVSDVTGAGDTVIAALSLFLAAGSSLEEAALGGNYAAGIAVENPGTYSVKLDELRRALMFVKK